MNRDDLMIIIYVVMARLFVTDLTNAHSWWAWCAVYLDVLLVLVLVTGDYRDRHARRL